MKSTIKKLEKSEVQIDITIPAVDFEKYRDRGFKKVQEFVQVDGFRKGNVPEDTIVKTYGDMIILEEMANLALRDAYIEVIKEEKIIPVTDPRVTINKIAKGNDLELSIIVAVMPEVTLPDYKKISKETVKGTLVEEVTEEEVNSVIEELRRGRAKFQEHEHTDAEHEHVIDESTIPELNDEFVQSFNPEFKTVDDFKKKIRENMKLEKEHKQKEKTRSLIVESLIEDAKADVPDVMIEQELDRMFGQMKSDVTRFGGTWEDYLKHINKTEEALRVDWRKDALKRTMSQLILAEIALVEKIKPTDEEIETELTRLLATVQDVDEERAKAYLYQALSNEKVLKFLEENK